MPPLTSGTERRRTVLKLLGAVAGAGTLGSAVHASTTGHGGDHSIVVEQGDDCYEVVPLSGDQPVEEFYDYRYPTDKYDSVSGSDGDSFSSAGTTDLQEDATSILFLYDGPQGLSLVVVHGRLDGDDDGGVASFTFEGMPADASWVVRDDYYLEAGEPALTNHDQWDVDGTTQQVDWAYIGGRTDGGAALGLGDEFAVTITPAFNEQAALDGIIETGTIDDWNVLSADGQAVERVPLLMDEPITIRTGTCGEETDAPVETPEEDPVETPDEPVDTPDDPVDTPDESDDQEDGQEGC